ncbi:MAG: hypothetical protein A4E73_02378 [Syntrophaceae bacterium PtaU1.Bin231]|nr:MAG: hypothetical protein A4E73_02378 [Syntrophaceae bacterium PtaU1.Bin231]
MEGIGLGRGVVVEEVVHPHPGAVPDAPGERGLPAEHIGQGELQEVADGDADRLLSVLFEQEAVAVLSLAARVFPIGLQISSQDPPRERTQEAGRETDAAVFPKVLVVLLQVPLQLRGCLRFHFPGSGAAAQVGEEIRRFDEPREIDVLPPSGHGGLEFHFAARRRVPGGKRKGVETDAEQAVDAQAFHHGAKIRLRGLRRIRLPFHPSARGWLLSAQGRFSFSPAAAYTVPVAAR